MKHVKLFEEFNGMGGIDYIYYINLDERGQFYADVRNPDTDESIYEIKIGYGEDEDNNPIEDGYMRHTEDIIGLEKYLKEMGIINQEDTIKEE